MTKQKKKRQRMILDESYQKKKEKRMILDESTMQLLNVDLGDDNE